MSEEILYDPNSNAVSNAVRMIDCHNHMLPDIDDGATSIDMALQMAQVSVNCGVTDVVLTPHHGNGAFSNYYDAIITAKQKLEEQLAEQRIPLRLHLGSELHLTPELPEQIRQGQVLTYADQKKAALIELPKQHLPLGVEAILGTCINMGITPVIAHPERNGDLARDPKILYDWIEWGCKTQLTALSLTGRFGPPIQEVANHWLANGCVHIVASDAHRVDGRSPNLANAYDYVCKHFGIKAANTLFYSNPKRLLNGEPLMTPVISQADNLSKKRSPSNTAERPKKHGLRAWLGL